jgi:ribosomal protein S18 acetylase RimI-like enzyme
MKPVHETGTPLWRPMAEADLPVVAAIADVVHAAHPEDPETFEERLHLYPDGCLVLEGAGGGVLAYVISHPWDFGRPPPLNTRLGTLPSGPDTCYIHDLALLPQTRGLGAGSRAVRRILSLAASAGLPSASLIAVSGSTRFWFRQGFSIVDDPALHGKIGSYGDDARFMAMPLPRA